MIIGYILILKINMKIGLIGEAPNDTLAIKNLLSSKYDNEKYEFINMLDHIHGSQLDNQKTKRLLRVEYEIKKPDLVIFIRDLDSLLPNKQKLNERRNYFTDFNRVVDKKGIWLLHIYEIEALILADIAAFNSIYSTNIEVILNPMTISEPKEFLKTASKKYNEIHNGNIFKYLDFNKLLNCAYFNKFINNLNKSLNC